MQAPMVNRPIAIGAEWWPPGGGDRGRIGPSAAPRGRPHAAAAVRSNHP